ncbi:hypothetical protein C8J56DRAFT_482706 [Mycena floridula]|nr:hypothetical protein C8J56DRAFT_482706 [Mycena floridula]
MSLLESFDDFGLEESFETQTLSFDRPRSLSHSMGQSDAFHPGLDTRPRSSSFNDASQLRLNIFEGSFSYNPSEPQSAPLSPLSPSVDFTGMESSVPSSPQNLSPQSPFAPHRRSLSLGGDESLDQQSQNTQLQHGDFLTVPKLSAPLQRHNATHGHRRNQTHSGHFEGMGRGRSLSPVPIGLGVPIDTNSRNWSPRSPSSQSSASSSYSPSPISPASPFNDDNYHEFQSEASVFSPDDTGLARRHSFGSNSSFEGHSDLGVHRTRSDPYPRPKSRTPSRSARGSQTDLVFKNQWPESMARYHQDGSSSQLDLHASEAGSSYGDDDGGSPVTLASDKIIAASNKRRKHQARFSCDICGQNFTARHNLQNHLNAHDGVKNFACKFCDFRAVTAAVATRHETNACKSNPGRVQVKKRS